MSKSFIAIIGLTALSLASSCLPTQCKPLARREELEQDPLIALPSETRLIGSDLGDNQQGRLVQYPPQEVSKHHQVNYIKPQEGLKTEIRQQVYYVADDQTMRPDSNSYLNYRNQYAVPETLAQVNTEPKHEYPGEILYINQQDDASKESQQTYPGQPPFGLSSLADRILKSSNSPATILAEIPIRDMPPEVLATLKKDYGVKVVATREHPGASLIINCEDYLDQNICIRTLEENSGSLNSNPTTPTYGETGAVSYEQPKTSSEVSEGEHTTYRKDSVETQPDQYHNRGGEPSSTVVEQTPTGETEEQANNDGFGYRSSSHNGSQTDRLSAQSEQPNSEKTDAPTEQTGFDAPTASV